MELFSEGKDTQISITWNDQEQKRVEEDYCEGCKTKDLRGLIGTLVENLVGDKKPKFVVENEKPGPIEELGIVPEKQENALGMVFFARGKNIVTPALDRIIKKNYEWIVENPDVQIQLEGHCYEEETPELNLALGERRGMAVFNYLVSLGANPSQFTIVSFGPHRPSTETLENDHCRVEFTRL